MRLLAIMTATLAACTSGSGFECTDRDVSRRLTDYAPAGASECITDGLLTARLYEECTGVETGATVESVTADCAENGDALVSRPDCWTVYLVSTCHELAQQQEGDIIGEPCRLFGPDEVIPSCAADL